MREPTREGALLDLLLVSREGLVGDTVVGGCFGHSHHKIRVFLILRAVRRGSAELPPWTYRGQTLCCLGDCFTESLERQSGRAEESRKA